ncbi:MAG: FkbM family methyltransferase, partial [Gemmatimonadota bacterium]|nr:FkbM family methyltransferase [Gemmatimonadota bacterium]
LDALAGAEQLIRREKPVLAVSAYHAQDHLWRVPLVMHAMNDGYRLFLRPHNEQGWDLVCYAVPEERTARPGNARG